MVTTAQSHKISSIHVKTPSGSWCVKCHLQAGVQNGPKVQAGGHVFYQRRTSVGKKRKKFKEPESEVSYEDK